MKKNQGITLIALIITIIILLILAGIIIDIAIDGKLFDKAQETVKDTNDKLGKDKNRIDGIINEWDDLEVGISGNTSGNETEDTPPANIGPVISKVALQSKTTNTITISSKATDENGDNLTYTLYTSTSQNGTYTKKTTTSGTQNTTVTLSATSLSNYTTYWWYVTVSDGEETVTSSKQSTRTYCPGTGQTCTTTSCSGTQAITCTTCNGNKIVTATCPGSTFGSCDYCGGIGGICGWCGGILNTGITVRVNGETCENCGYSKSQDGIMLSCDEHALVAYLIDCEECGFRNFVEIAGGYGAHECPNCDRICAHGYLNAHEYSAKCETCAGVGTINTPPCIHGYSSTHRYCSHYTNTTLTSHSYCLHGRTSQHDD